MGCCLSSPAKNPHQQPPAKIRRIHKSQISAPVSLTSSSSDEAAANEDIFTHPRRAPKHTPYPLEPLSAAVADGNKDSAKGPLLVLQPPTPRKDSVVETGSKYGFRLGTEDDAARQNALSLAQEVAYLASLIGKLAHAIRAYSFLNTQTKQRTLGDLQQLIVSLPRPPQGVLLRRSLTQLYDQVETLYEEKNGIWKSRVGRAIEHDVAADTNRGNKLLACGIESLWGAFLSLSDEAKRDMACGLDRRCLLMAIFNLLGSLRAGSEELLVVDLRISRVLEGGFDEVLIGLKGLEGNQVRYVDEWSGGHDGEGKGGEEGEAGREDGGGSKGWVGDGGSGSPSMQWRVLGIVEEKRREALQRSMEVIKRGRGEVSVALLSIVEGLAEGL